LRIEASQIVGVAGNDWLHIAASTYHAMGIDDVEVIVTFAVAIPGAIPRRRIGDNRSSTSDRRVSRAAVET